MFLKLTELTFDFDPRKPPREEEIFIQSTSILSMRRTQVYLPDQFCTTIYVGTNHWPRVKETPEEIIDMVYGQCK
jgi:hypothetical protein